MLYEIMKSIKNFFPTGIQEDDCFTIEEGILSLPFVREGQYILIEGSAFNDGVYQYPCSNLQDEEFLGVITVLAPPKAFLILVDDIEKYQSSAPALGAYASENFGNYSYTRATNSNGSPAQWQDIFRSRLNAWRKI